MKVLNALRKNEERFLLPAQADKMFAYKWDTSTDAVVLSDECAHVFGVGDVTPITGLHVLSKVHPDDRERLTTAFSELTPENPIAHISFRMVHPTRGVIWVETDCVAFFDGEGRMLWINGKVGDITPRKLHEIELAIAHDRLHLAMDAGKSVGWDWDIKSGRDFWFGDLQTVFGIPSKTYTGHVDDFRRRVHPDDRGLVWQAVKNAIQGRTLYVAEFRILWEDGTVRWVAAQGKCYYLSNGEPERMLGIAVDITERKGAEDALRRKDIELTEAQRLAGVGSWQWELDTDIVTWSDELYRIAGRDPNLPPFSYKEFSQLYTAESWARLQLAVQEILWIGTQYELELEIIRPDGTTRWVIGRGEAYRDDAGRIVRIRGTIQDITESRQSQKALRDSEERLRLAAQAGRMYAFEWDKSSDVIVRHAEYRHILGLTNEPKDITCREVLEAVHPDDRAKVDAATDECTAENPTVRVKYRFIRPDGSTVWLEKNALAFFDEKGELLRMIGMVADITERKLAEEVLSGLSRRLIEAQENERSRIARELHDDISQRLAMLSVTLEQMRQATPELERDVHSRIDELRRQILDISSGIHSLSHELHSSKLRHLDMINAMRGFCMELSEQQNVEIDFSYKNIPSSMPQEVSLCLFRILQEALHNAAKHSRERHFQVEIRGTSDAVHLSIRDLGVGFDPEAAMKSHGLGLTSMKERLNLVNGELSIESKPMRGTTIHARVPLGPGNLRASTVNS